MAFTPASIQLPIMMELGNNLCLVLKSLSCQNFLEIALL